MQGIDTLKMALTNIAKNIEKVIAFIVFLCTFCGAWFLLDYANNHGVKFTDLTTPYLLICAGAISLFILAFIAYILLASFYFSPEISKGFYINHIARSKLKNKFKRIKTLYMFYFFHFLSSSILLYWPTLGISLSLITLTTFHLYTSHHKGKVYFVKKNLSLIAYSYAFSFSAYLILTCLSIILDFKIRTNELVEMVINTFWIFLISFFLSNIGFIYMHDKKDNRKFRILSFLSLSLFILIYISMAFSNNLSVRVANLMGLGFQYRCFYSEDLKQHHIPENLITLIDKKRTKLFIIADINNKVYISKDKDHRASFMFSKNNLSEIHCAEDELNK